MIEAQSLTKRFGAKTPVDGITSSAKPGAVLGLLGPNGAGKPEGIEVGPLPVVEETAPSAEPASPSAEPSTPGATAPDGTEEGTSSTAPGGPPVGPIVGAVVTIANRKVS